MSMKTSKDSGRGRAINIYLRLPALRALSILRDTWGCTWGQVIERLLAERKKR